MAISMLKIRRPLGRLIFNMGIAIPGKTVFLIETAPSSLICCAHIYVSIGMIEVTWSKGYTKVICTESNEETRLKTGWAKGTEVHHKCTAIMSLELFHQTNFNLWMKWSSSNISTCELSVSLTMSHIAHTISKLMKWVHCHLVKLS